MGPVHAGFVTVAPSTPHDVWDGVAWVTDTAAQHAADVAAAEQKKSALRAATDAEIAWRQDAADAGIATAEEAAALAEWKKYRVLLMRVDTANPVWPPQP
ncbi:tail fiber assembly protein [Atlantibacter hermannii]|uniref:tail fiber assembly protein n=1 Tax=Atlantibacter hermannii TaxID=565 RepID=UPI003A5C7F96